MYTPLLPYLICPLKADAELSTFLVDAVKHGEVHAVAGLDAGRGEEEAGREPESGAAEEGLCLGQGGGMRGRTGGDGEMLYLLVDCPLEPLRNDECRMGRSPLSR